MASRTEAVLETKCVSALPCAVSWREDHLTTRVCCTGDRGHDHERMEKAPSNAPAASALPSRDADDDVCCVTDASHVGSGASPSRPPLRPSDQPSTIDQLPVTQQPPPPPPPLMEMAEPMVTPVPSRSSAQRVEVDDIEIYVIHVDDTDVVFRTPSPRRSRLAAPNTSPGLTNSSRAQANSQPRHALEKFC